MFTVSLGGETISSTFPARSRLEKYMDHTAPGPPLHVLVVSNHAEVRSELPFSGIYAERQVLSLRKAGIRISTFDIGASHSAIHLLRKWRQLRRTVRSLKPQVVHARYGTVVAALTVLSGNPTVITFCGSDLNAGELQQFSLPTGEKVCAGIRR